MKDCPSFPGYSVSADGVVISTRRRRKPLTLRPSIGTKGYLAVAVATPTGIRPVGVHVLVADAFIGAKPFAGAQVRHLDGNAQNNCASNLAWGSATENAADRLRHGRYARGAQHHNAKLNEEQVREVLARRADGEKVLDLARAFRVGVSTVENIIYRKQWKHVNFKRVTT